MKYTRGTNTESSGTQQNMWELTGTTRKVGIKTQRTRTFTFLDQNFKSGLISSSYVTFEVTAVVTMTISVLWAVTQIINV
jgi:hypothetical protein